MLMAWFLLKFLDSFFISGVITPFSLGAVSLPVQLSAPFLNLGTELLTHAVTRKHSVLSLRAIDEEIQRSSYTGKHPRNPAGL